MLCPLCKTKLAHGPQMPLQTLEEHVYSPNDTPAMKDSFWCPSKTCRAHQMDLVWNEDGEIYGAYKTKKMPWIDGNNAPFGSFQRKMNVEVYKKDENRTLFTIPNWKWLPFHGWTCNSRWEYTSNEDGDILTRRMQREWITRENFVHVWGMSMLVYSLKNIYKAWRQLGQDSTKTRYIQELRDTVKRRYWPNSEWWRKIAACCAKLALKNRHIPFEEPKGELIKIF